MTVSIPDELVYAYVDGELSDADRVLVEEAMAQQASVAERVQRQQALRGNLQKAYEEVLEEPIPERLLQAAHLLSCSELRGIIDSASVRAERPRSVWSHFSANSVRVAIAASLLIGAFLGLGIEHFSSNGNLIEFRNGTMLASGALATILDDQLANAVPPSAPIRVGLSFEAKTGNYCRTFTAIGVRRLDGLACNHRQRWRILTLIEGPLRGDAHEYRMADSNLPPELLQAIGANIRGEPLDAQAERRARSSGWRSPRG